MQGNKEVESVLNKRLFTRIQTLIDVVYALVLFNLFTILPLPTKEMIFTNDFSSWLSDGGASILTVVIGIVWIIIYWGQSNVQFGHLKAANKTLASLSIVQLFILMLFLYFIKLDNETDADVLALFSQSVCLTLAGLLGIWFWKYASKKDMVLDDMTKQENKSILYSFYPEPITAFITIPLAFIDVWWYSIGWLLIIPLGMFFKKRAGNA